MPNPKGVERIAPTPPPPKTSRPYTLGVRLSPKERLEIEGAARNQGWEDTSSWARAVLLWLIRAGMEVVLDD